MTEINGYQQSDDENHIEVVDLPTLGEEAQKVIPTGGFGYISGGSENDWTEKVNQQAFTHKQIVPRVLSGVDNPSTETSLLGIDTSMPILMTPLAAHGLAHSQGEKDTAKGAAAAGTIMSSSTYSTFSIQDIAAAGNGAPQFFQLYLSKNRDINKAWLGTAVKSGAPFFAFLKEGYYNEEKQKSRLKNGETGATGCQSTAKTNQTTPKATSEVKSKNYQR